jgi:hypothetical protein
MPPTAPVVPGRRRAPAAALLALAVLAVAVVGVPVASAQSAPEAPEGAAWMEVHLYLDAVTGFFGRPCSADFGVAPFNPPLGENDDVGGCNGSWRGDGTSPFNAGAGTITWPGASGDHPDFDLNIYVSGAELRGHVPDRSSDRLTITSGITPWGSAVVTGSDPSAAAGEQGGPLHLDVTAASGTDHGYTFDIRGWVLVTPPSAEPPADTTVVPDTTAPTSSTTSTTAAARPTTAVTPRFTG